MIIVDIIIIVIAIVIIDFVRKKKRYQEIEEYKYTYHHGLPSSPYKLTKYLLSEDEHKFYLCLKQITDKYNITVMAKTRLTDFILCNPHIQNYYYWYNGIATRHTDFLLCDEQMHPILAIEFDENPSKSPEQTENDNLIDEIYISVNLKHIHIRDYTDAQLESLVTKQIEISKLKEL